MENQKVFGFYDIKYIKVGMRKTPSDGIGLRIPYICLLRK